MQDEDNNLKDDRLKDLSTRLQKARGEEQGSHDTSQQAKDQRQGIAFGLRAGLELVVATFVGFAMGYFLDGFLGTRPFLMIIFGFLGVGAGISNIYRLFNKMDSSVGYKSSKDSQKKP